MSKRDASSRLTFKGLAIVAMATLFVAAIGFGIAQGGGKSKALTKKQANKTYLTKKAADGKFLTKQTADGAYQPKETKLQVPASTAQPVGAATSYSDTNGSAAGALHAGAGFGNIGWSWILPPNYPAGSPLTVNIYYALGASGCNFNFEPNSLSINRFGSNSTGSQNDINNGVDILPAPPANQVTGVTWTIPGTVQGVQLTPGTSVLMGTFRNADSVGDTCAGNVALKGLEVSW